MARCHLALSTRADKLKTAAAMGSVAVALFTGKILMDTGMYYDYFGSVDKAWVKWGVAVGCLASV